MQQAFIRLVIVVRAPAHRANQRHMLVEHTERLCSRFLVNHNHVEQKQKPLLFRTVSHKTAVANTQLDYTVLALENNLRAVMLQLTLQKKKVDEVARNKKVHTFSSVVVQKSNTIARLCLHSSQAGGVRTTMNVCSLTIGCVDPDVLYDFIVHGVTMVPSCTQRIGWRCTNMVLLMSVDKLVRRMVNERILTADGSVPFSKWWISDEDAPAHIKQECRDIEEEFAVRFKPGGKHNLSISAQPSFTRDRIIIISLLLT